MHVSVGKAPPISWRWEMRRRHGPAVLKRTAHATCLQGLAPGLCADLHNLRAFDRLPGLTLHLDQYDGEVAKARVQFSGLTGARWLECSARLTRQEDDPGRHRSPKTARRPLTPAPTLVHEMFLRPR